MIVCFQPVRGPLVTYHVQNMSFKKEVIVVNALCTARKAYKPSEDTLALCAFKTISVARFTNKV